MSGVFSEAWEREAFDALVAHPYGMAAMEIASCRSWMAHDLAMQVDGASMRDVYALRAAANRATILFREVEEARARARGRGRT